MLKSSLAFAVMALCVKAASLTLPSLEIVFFRSVMGLSMTLAVIRWKKISILGRERGLMVLRGFCGFLALTLYVYAITRLPLGTAVFLNYTSPVLAGLISILVLKERPQLWLLLVTGLSFYGVYLLTGGTFHGDWKAVIAGLLSAVFAGFAYVFIRAVKYRESPMTIIFYFTAISSFGSLFFLPFFGFVWPQGITWLYLAGIGIGAFYGQLWLTISLRRAPASLVSPLSYLTPLLSFGFGWLFFGDSALMKQLFGAFLIIVSGSLISILGTKRDPKRSADKQKFSASK